MSEPSVVFETPVYHVNLTVLLSIITVSLTAMGTLVAVFRKKIKDEDKPAKSPFCAQHINTLQRLENEGKERDKKIEKFREECSNKIAEIKQIGNDNGKEVGILKSQSDNATKGIDEMRTDVKEVATKLDDLLKQLLDWMAD